jgi:hypothetical protein
MSDVKKLDTYIKDAMANYSPDVPGDVWQKILDSRKGKKRSPFWLSPKKSIAVVLLAALTGTTLLIINWRNNKTSTTDNTVISKLAEKPVSPATNAQENSTTEKLHNPTTSVDAGKNEQAQSLVTGNHPIANKTAVRANIADVKTSTKNKKGEENIKEPTSRAKNYRTNSNDNNLVKAPTKIFKKKSKSFFDIQNADAFGNDDNMNIEATDQLDQPFLSTRYKYTAEKITAASLLNEENKTVVKSIDPPGCPEMEKDAAANKYYWEMYAGPDYAIKKFNGADTSTLVEKRKQSTSFRSAFSVGVRYTRVFANAMSLRAGINFSEINEKFSYVQSNVVQLTYVIDPVTGDTTDRYYVRGNRYKNNYNHYRTIDVPVVIGYELGNGPLYVNINAGVVINLYSWQNGETLDTSFQPVSFNSAKNSSYQYKTNVGLGFTGATSFYYKINENMHLLAEPYFRYNFSPINNQAISLQEKFTTIGLRLGLRVDIN